MKTVILSASSDIGIALTHHWLDQGHQVYGTYRTHTEKVSELAEAGATLIRADLSDTQNCKVAATELANLSKGWDTLVVAPGLQAPVGLFLDCDFDEWHNSVDVNFTNQARFMHALLPYRNQSNPLGPITIMFAGGGTNNATAYYSAYTVAKIASIKFTELLDHEIPDSRFVILGPGWVKTKIHQTTLNAKERAGENYTRTQEKLSSDECVPMSKVIEICDWMVSRPRDVIGGRNLSLVFDDWGNPDLDRLLREDPNMYKLRRYGNEKLPRPVPISEATS